MTEEDYDRWRYMIVRLFFYLTAYAAQFDFLKFRLLPNIRVFLVMFKLTVFLTDAPCW